MLSDLPEEKQTPAVIVAFKGVAKTLLTGLQRLERNNQCEIIETLTWANPRDRKPTAPAEYVFLADEKSDGKTIPSVKIACKSNGDYTLYWGRGGDIEGAYKKAYKGRLTLGRNDRKRMEGLCDDVLHAVRKEMINGHASPSGLTR